MASFCGIFLEGQVYRNSSPKLPPISSTCRLRIRSDDTCLRHWWPGPHPRASSSWEWCVDSFVSQRESTLAFSKRVVRTPSPCISRTQVSTRAGSKFASLHQPPASELSLNLAQWVKVTGQGCQIWCLNWVRSVPNGTNLGHFKIKFQYILAQFESFAII